MGLFQKALETYNEMEHIAGMQVENGMPLAPAGYIIAPAKIEIVITDEGGFVSASKIDEKVLVPATEMSAGRTSGISPHPLCDKLEYVADVIPEKHGAYLSLLGAWADSEYTTPEINAVHSYAENGTILDDLTKAGILEPDSKDIAAELGQYVKWCVKSSDGNVEDVCYDRHIQESFLKFYEEVVRGADEKKLCMITGRYAVPALQHIKGISNLSANAKLISSNDKRNYTYRGRFETPDQAVSISYEASQKAHNALKWLVSNQSINLGDKDTDCRLLCWNSKCLPIPKVTGSLWAEIHEDEEKADPVNYRRKLNEIVYGYGRELPESESVAIAILGTTTTKSGRMSVLYYNELPGADFLDRLASWDVSCCWYHSRYGVCSPSLYAIAECAYGVQRKKSDDAPLIIDGAVKSRTLQALIASRVDKRSVPENIVRALVQKASNLQILNTKNRIDTLFTACAVIRKYREDRYKEVWDMSLEKDRKDRSYQYGRLLAVLEKLEKDALDKSETRLPNAVKLQAFYVQRPEKAAAQLVTHLKTCYYQKLSPGGRAYYDKLIGEIMENISNCGDAEEGKPLTETYLMGYSLQNNALYAKKEEEEK